MNGPDYSPFKKTLLYNDFRFDEDSLSFVKESLKFQEVCTLLGSKLEEFTPPEDPGLSYRFLLNYHPRNAWVLRRENFTCYVWVYDTNCPRDKLGEATVRASIDFFIFH